MSLAKRIVPLFDRVLIRKVLPQTKTASGIILPESSMNKLNEGLVVAVGTGRPASKDGPAVPVCVKEGDKVLLPEYGGNQIKLDNEEFTLYREQDLLGILKDK